MLAEWLVGLLGRMFQLAGWPKLEADSTFSGPPPFQGQIFEEMDRFDN